MRKTLVAMGSGALLTAACVGPDLPEPPIVTDSAGSTTGDATTTLLDPTTSGAPGDSSSSGPLVTTAVDSTTLDDSPTGPGAICGNDEIEDGEECDGLDLGGEDCASRGFDGGELACAASCSSYDTSGCINYNCGNNTIEGNEACDGPDLGGATCTALGFDSGTLSCRNDCSDFITSGCGTCGNVIVEGTEVCDGVALLGQNCVTQGFEYGQIACGPDCTAFDTSGCGLCGDGSQGGTESCDGADLGGATCASLGLTGGTLGCSASCQFDFSACDLAGTLFGSDSGYNGFSLTPPVLPCDEISATGTPTFLSDDAAVSVPMGFTFPVYGTGYSNITINSNGTVRWGDDTYLTLANTCLPSNTAPTTRNLYVYWDDLNPAAAGEVYYQTLGAAGNQRFVVQWDVPHYSGNTADLMRIQAMFHQVSGQIDVCYVDTLNAANTSNSGASATAGIQLDAAAAVQYSCNAPNLVNGLQLLYLPI